MRKLFRIRSVIPVLLLALVLLGPAAMLGSPPDPRSAPSGPKVFAHYFPPYPISLDNADPRTDYYARNYLSITGEGGKHAAYGGWLRDRPQPRQPLDDPDWRVEDLKTEVRQAKAAGIDGFTLNIMGISGSNWEACLNLMRAAEEVGDFEVVPNLDANAGIANLPPARIAARLAELYAYPSAGTSGRQHLLSSFAAERRDPTWWRGLIGALEGAHDVPISFTAVFLNASPANMRRFAPISDGFGNWGSRTPDSAARSSDLVSAAHALGKTWMEPVAFQDARHYTGDYAEAGNTETGRASWARAIRQRADSVQLVTWNDYTESTSIAPSVAHGTVLLDISSYYIQWFKRGAPTAITEDKLFVTHRIQPWAARPVTATVAMRATLEGSRSTPPRDTVEALTFLSSPATVTITSGGRSQTFQMPAGVSAATVPLRPGSVSAQLRRGSTIVQSVTSPHLVTARPLVPDLQYYAAAP